jgi:hypothetical protein
MPNQNSKELENERSVDFKFVVSTRVNPLHLEALNESQIS